MCAYVDWLVILKKFNYIFKLNRFNSDVFIILLITDFGWVFVSTFSDDDNQRNFVCHGSRRIDELGSAKPIPLYY